MLSKPVFQRLYIVTAVFCWVFLFFFGYYPALININVENQAILAVLNTFFLGLFSLATFLFYRLLIGTFEGEGFNELLWKVSITGLATLVIITVYNITNGYLIDKSYPDLYVSLAYHASISITVIFLSSCFFVFKRMILYQKSKEILNLWKVFEYLIYTTLVLNFLNLTNKDMLFQLCLIPILVMGIILALNLKWIAYLNFRQKLNSIIYIIILLSISLFIAWFIFGFGLVLKPSMDMADNIFILSLLIFIIFYCFFSLLVLVFNLPTSSVFEKKFGEVLNFQKLSRSVQAGKTEDEVYHLLIDSCMASMMASSCTLELYDENRNPQKFVFKGVDKDQFYEIKTFLRKNALKIGGDYLLIEELKKELYYADIEALGFLSLLALPLLNYNERIGTIYLFSEIKNGFEKEMIDLVSTYVHQACTSISNFRLIHQAVEHARYKQEMEIAKHVQAGLLPARLINNGWMEMAAVSVSADEVGGDYYDYVQISDKKYVIAIGDVSGKGTSAAFHMAKLKGVFNSLARLNLPADIFIAYANQALSACLDKSSFVTFTILIIDLDQNTLETSRAGHCPTLIYDASRKRTYFLEQQGMGLGIIRNDSYSNQVRKEQMHLKKGDIIMLYTDGIVEAENANGEDFDYSRLKDFLSQNNHLEIEDLKEKFLVTLKEFCGDVKIEDDYSFLFIKIRN